MNNKEAIFDFDVPDWEYHCMVTGNGSSPRGDVSFLILIYRDGSWKATGRVKFPQSTTMVLQKEFTTKKLAIDGAFNCLDGIADPATTERYFLGNPDLTGKSMFEAMRQCPHLMVTYRKTNEEEDVPS